MKLKRDSKFGEKLTCHFKIDIKNLTNFDVTTRKSQKFSLKLAPFEQIIYSLSRKSTEKFFHETEEGYKIWIEIDLSF